MNFTFRHYGQQKSFGVGCKLKNALEVTPHLEIE